MDVSLFHAVLSAESQDDLQKTSFISAKYYNIKITSEKTEYITISKIICSAANCKLVKIL